jgi:hypothetical protein
MINIIVKKEFVTFPFSITDSKEARMQVAKNALEYMRKLNRKEPNNIYIMEIKGNAYNVGTQPDFHNNPNIDIMAVMWKNSCISCL